MAAIGIRPTRRSSERAAARPRDEAVECAVAAERLGFDAVSVNDHVTCHEPWLDRAPTLLAAAAARTRIDPPG